MSLAFPKADLLTGLRFAQNVEAFSPMWRQETSRTADGVTFVKELGPLLWKAQYVTVPMVSDAAAALEADLLSLDGGAQVFEGYDPRKPLPASDKVAALNGITIQSIQADRKAVQLTGLPSDYTVTSGDWLSVDDGTNLHLLKVVETVIGSGVGVSPMFEVRPALRPAIAVSDPVVMRYAPARFMLEQGSVKRTPKGGLYEVVSWSAIQVLT